MIKTLLGIVAAVAAKLPRNRWFWAYQIATNGDPYITRVLFPRAFGWQMMIHHIHRPDLERHCHNHPWHRFHSVILSGGYTEERVVDHDEELVTAERILRPGDRNRADATDFHRITAIEPNTWTALLIGRKVQSWGFIVEPQHVVHHKLYKKWQAKR